MLLRLLQKHAALVRLPLMAFGTRLKCHASDWTTLHACTELLTADVLYIAWRHDDDQTGSRKNLTEKQLAANGIAFPRPPLWQLHGAKLALFF